ncbi:MAG: RnfABCDGE type electron transport complex subunit D [Ruminococcus sp.]|nr:RnfABCDGE type electron transport complex subunit D [Ruminococcus sp.]
MDNKMYVSSSPHFRCNTSTTKIMLDVIIALVPAVIASVIFFGPYSLMLIGVCIASCVICEYISRKIMKRDTTIGDLSAVVTGLLLALNLPVNINPLIAVFGSIVAIVVVKQMFGGIGMNFVNPAIAARIVLLVSFPNAMMTWVEPFWYKAGVDATTSATPLVTGDVSYVNLLLGNHGGSLGETCAVALLLGGVYLVIRKVISPIIPCVYILSAGVMSLVLGQDPIYQILSGGLLLGAIFMATDYVTSPYTKWGKVIFAIGCGVLTILLRTFSNMPEGVSFSIILMNILVPLIEMVTTPKAFGKAKKAKGDKK